MYVDGLAVAPEIGAPHVFQKRVPRLDAPRVGDQVRDEAELARRQPDVHPVERDSVSGPVNDERTDGVALRHSPRALGLGLRSPQDRIDACDDLTHRERLGDVVVGAKLEADDLVYLRVLGREHDDRDAA